jgi:hypothetical protein
LDSVDAVFAAAGTGTSVGLNVGSGKTLSVAGTLTSTGTSSFSANPTFSGGTANGVAYLNGSKVVTSGSALTFNGTSLGVGSSDYGNAGSINLSVGVAGTTTGGVQLWSTTSGTHYLQFGDSTAGAATYSGAVGYNHSADALLFLTSGSEQMRLTSTGLGIGTSSAYASSRLSVAGVGYFAGDGSSTQQIRMGFTNGTSYWWMGRDNASTGDLIVGQGGGGTQLTLTTTGNLGLGVTPSAWGGPFDVIQMGTYGQHIAGQTNTADIKVGANNYYNGTNYVYTVSGTGAAQYNISGSTGYQWSIAASGTAGNAITFTQAATLDASGHFMIGTTSTTGSASNDKIVAGGRFRTVSGSVSATTATATTLFTAPAGLGAYLVTVNIDADDVANYGATYVVNTQGNSSTVATLIYKGNLISISVSGSNVRVTQTSGATQTIQYSAVRIF